MAKRKDVPRQLRLDLVTDAGGKCANPGCSNRLVQLHHINEWAVYRTHDAKDMVAVCGACHDAIHRGALPISDATLREWKQVRRDPGTVRDNIFVEPAPRPKLLLGSVALESKRSGLTVFELSPANRLSFEARGEDVLLASLTVSTLGGAEVVRVENNILRHKTRTDISFRRIPGWIEIFAPASEEFIPRHVLEQMRDLERFYALGDRVRVLGLRVLKPGLLRVEGLWSDGTNAVVITDRSLAFCRPDGRRPMTLIGDGESSVLLYDGPITTAMFRFQ